MDYEIRTAEMWPEADYEMRAAGDGLTLDGYAAVFNLPSLPMSFMGVGGGKLFREVIHPGAFAKTLAEMPDVTLRYQHNLTTLPLGRTKSGTLELAEDARGLRVHATLPDNEWGRPIRDAVARGDVSGMSFRFSKVIDKWEADPSGHTRHLHEVKLGPEVSVTDYPAYPDTSVMVRHLAEEAGVEADDLAEAFRALRDPEARLTAEQHALLMAAINTRVDEPFVGPRLARARERLLATAH
ncbi:MAG TPA: HK97 family phage prohead protease [Actinomycetes bacterium]|nr:HK97 family phage prohead protease [Actinomycetes bacterium]